MKLIVESATFGEALRRASTAMSKVSIPVLSCVHLSAADGVLTIRATDMEQAMRIEVDANVIEPGTICVSAERLKNFSPPDGSQIAMGVAGTQVKIKAGTRQMTLPIMPGEFPTIDDPKLDAQIKLDGADLIALLDMTEFAVDQVRGSHFGGICLRSKDGKLCAAATNNKMIAEFVSEIASDDFPQIVVPRAFLPALQASLDGPITLGVGQGRISIIGATTSFTCRLLDAKFPEYGHVLRPTSPVTFRVSASALGDELNRAISFSGDKDSTVYLSVAAALTMRAGRTERFEAELPMTAPATGTERINFATNGRMLKAMCDVAGDHDVVLSMIQDDKSPIIITSPDISGLTMLLALCASNESQFVEVAA